MSLLSPSLKWSFNAVKTFFFLAAFLLKAKQLEPFQKDGQFLKYCTTVMWWLWFGMLLAKKFWKLFLSNTTTFLGFYFSWSLDNSFELTCTSIAGLFHAWKVKIWLSCRLLSNIVSVGRGGEDKGRAWTKIHWHPKGGGANGGVPAGEGRWVCHGCAWFCDACCEFNTWLHLPQNADKLQAVKRTSRAKSVEIDKSQGKYMYSFIPKA